MNIGIEMWMTGSLAVAGLGVLLGIIGLLQVRRAGHDRGRLQQELEQANARHTGLAAELSTYQKRTDSLTDRLEQLNLQLGRVDGSALRLGLREAIALSRRGADTEELVDTCGIGHSEAHLIRLLHRRADGVADADTGNGAELN
jgi:hypothetical protein